MSGGGAIAADADGERRPAPAFSGWLLVVLALAVFGYGAARFWPRTVDDSFIVYRYARNLVDGAGPVFNPGERVEGYSSPSWMFLMAGAIGVGLDPVPASKVLGIGASVALLLVLHRALSRAGVGGWRAGAVPLLLGSSPVLAMWSTAGLETNAYALLFFAGVLELAAGRTLGASACLAAAAVTRPEGLVFWAFGWPLAWVSGGSRGAARYALPGLLPVVHLVWRIAYYGDPLPNTYYVKTGGGAAMWSQGLHGLALFAASPAQTLLLAAAAAGTVLALSKPKERLAVAIVAGAVVAHLAYVVSVGDDGLRIHRFQAPVLAPLAYLAGLLFLRGPALRMLGTVAVVLAVPASLLALRAETRPEAMEGARIYQEGNVRLGRLLGATSPPGTRIAVAAAGAIPYYSQLPTIDVYGLNDRHIAHEPFPEGRRGRLMKWDNAYVLGLRPDLIVVNRGYFPAGDPAAGEVARNPRLLAESAMDRDLFTRLRVDGGYTLRPIRFDDGALFYVFERRR